MPIDPYYHSINPLMSDKLQFEELTRILKGAGVGTWSIDLFEEQHPRMYVNAKIAELMGIRDVSALSPEELYDYWFERVGQSALDSVLASICGMKSGKVEEIIFQWNHPLMGNRYLRFAGSGKVAEGNGYVLNGYCRDVTPLVLKERGQQNAIKQMGLEIKKAYDAVQFVSRSCTSIYRINLQTNMYAEIRTDLQPVRELVGTEGDAREAFRVVCEKVVKPQWREKMRAFTDLNWVREQLKDKPILKQEFEGNIRGWSLASFVPGERNEDGSCDDVVWLTVDINEQKTQEMKQRAALQT